MVEARRPQPPELELSEMTYGEGMATRMLAAGKVVHGVILLNEADPTHPYDFARKDLGIFALKGELSVHLSGTNKKETLASFNVGPRGDKEVFPIIEAFRENYSELWPEDVAPAEVLCVRVKVKLTPQ